jgi:hypothetical protein
MVSLREISKKIYIHFVSPQAADAIGLMATAKNKSKINLQDTFGS